MRNCKAQHCGVAHHHLNPEGDVISELPTRDARTRTVNSDRANARFNSVTYSLSSMASKCSASGMSGEKSGFNSLATPNNLAVPKAFKEERPSSLSHSQVSESSDVRVGTRVREHPADCGRLLLSCLADTGTVAVPVVAS